MSEPSNISNLAAAICLSVGGLTWLGMHALYHYLDKRKMRRQIEHWTAPERSWCSTPPHARAARPADIGADLIGVTGLGSWEGWDNGDPPRDRRTLARSIKRYARMRSIDRYVLWVYIASAFVTGAAIGVVLGRWLLPALLHR